jgi:hypothetical protein
MNRLSAARRRLRAGTSRRLSAAAPRRTGTHADRLAVEELRPCRLRLYDTHTGERLDVVYRRGVGAGRVRRW